MSKVESQPAEKNDDDDDQTNSSHKIVPYIHKSISSEINRSNNSKFDVQNLIKNDLKTYLNTIIPKDYSDFVQCHVKREKKGIPATFSLYFNGKNENEQIFLLSARKNLTFGGHVEYFIGTNPNDENFIAKLRGLNISATEYILYDHQNSLNNNNQSSLAIIYDAHIFGSRELRKLTVLLCDNQKTNENETIINQWRSGYLNNFIELKNQIPTYDEESKVYGLKMNGNRIIQPSHKNFQLIPSDDDHENNISMQFGRIDEHKFALDYRYPLTIIQAFAIALSSFHSRFRP